MNVPEPVSWKIGCFEQLSLRELYLLVKLRVDVFVVEQTCPYPELDGKDLLEDTVHIVGSVNDTPVAYARILAPKNIDALALTRSDTGSRNTQNNPVYIGRVVVDSDHRGLGLASTLMRQALAHCENHFPDHSQALAAQVSVQAFYASLGFRACSEPYLDDGIAHVDMVRSATTP